MTKTMSSKASKAPPKQASLNSFFKTKNGDPLKPPKRKDVPDISKFMVSKKEKSKDTKEPKHSNNNDDDNANVEKKKPQDTKTIDTPDTPQTAAGGSSDEEETETALLPEKPAASTNKKSSNDKRKNDDKKDDDDNNNKKQKSGSNDETTISKKKRVKRSSIQESKRSEEEDSKPTTKENNKTKEETANMTSSTSAKRSKRSSIQESKQCEKEDDVTMEKKVGSSTTKNAKEENPPSKKRAKRSSIQESKMAENEDHSSSTSALSKTTQTKKVSSGTMGEELEVLTKKTNGKSSKKRRTIMEDSDEEEEDDSPMDGKNDAEMSSIVDASSASTKKENNTDAITKNKATSTNGFFEKRTTQPEATTTKKKRNTKRSTVLEDSDDDEVLQNTKKEDSDFEDKEEANDDDDDEVLSDENDGDTCDDVDDDEEEDDNKKLSTSVSKNGKKATTKKSVNDVLKHSTKKPTTKKATGGSGVVKKAESMAKGMKSNEALLDKSTFPYLWDKGSDVPYLALCEIFTSIEAISGRLDIQQLLTELFRQCILLMPEENGTTASTTSKGNTKNNNDLLNLIYLASNTVAPPYECVELGIGDAILIKAIGESYGTNASMIKQRYDKAGDLGSVAASAKGMQRTLSFGMKPKPLMAREVLTVFRQIATTSGSQSQKWKVDKIKGLLVRAKGPEAKYVIRGLQGKLRIGLAQTTVLASLAHALVLSPPPKTQISSNDESKKIVNGETEEEYPDTSRKLCNPKTPLDEKLDCAVQIVKKSFSELPSFDALMEAALTAPLWEFFRTCTLKPGIPVEPMLAKPTKSVLEVLKRLNSLKFTCEYKYDGERAQIHMMSTTEEGADGTLSNTKTTTKVFSRNMLETSEKYPEVPLYVKEACCDDKVTSYIMDTEVVAYNRQTGHFVPFQILSTRKKQEETAETAKVQIIVQAFDLMYLNGKSLLNKTLQERRELLHSHFQVVEGKFRFAISKDFQEDGETNEIEEFLDAAIKNKCEGLMVKTLEVNANYEPSRRSLNWLKLKKDYLEGLGDSVDLVPIGAFVGKGKRTGVYGAYLLACYDVDTEEYQSVCKIGTGFSDANLVSLAEGLNKHIIPEKSSQYNVSETLQCDVWFDAVQVWEVKAADLSKSSTHKGAIDKTGETGRGIGLRFPRFERLREDKKPEQATTSDQILDMYYNQDTVQGHDDAPGGGGGGDDDDDGI